MLSVLLARIIVKSPVPLGLSRLARCERRLWDRLCLLDDNQLHQALDPWLSPHELDCLLARRRVLVELIRSWIDERGADAVLYALPAPERQPGIPSRPSGDCREAASTGRPGASSSWHISSGRTAHLR